MTNKDKLPRFMAADNPLVNGEMYVIHTRKPFAILRANDLSVVMGEANEGMKERAKDWLKSYSNYINK